MHWCSDWEGVCYCLILSVFSSSPSPFPHLQGFLVGKAEVQVASRLLQVSYISSHRSLGPLSVSSEEQSKVADASSQIDRLTKQGNLTRLVTTD